MGVLKLGRIAIARTHFALTSGRCELDETLDEQDKEGTLGNTS